MNDQAHITEIPLSIHGLHVAYGNKVALWDIDLEIPAGQLTAVVGPNGAGKSTLLKAALGLVPHTSGQARFFGQPFASVRGRVAYVPQRESVDWDFPVSAQEVVAMGLYRAIGWCKPVNRKAKQEALAALEQVGLADYATRPIGQLSGGQQQRVFLARALVQSADLYLMDEPLAGVDAATENAVFLLLQRLRDAGKAVVCVHHDLPTVPEHFDRVVLLNRRLVAQGPVKEIFTRENLRQTYGGALTLLDEALQSAGQAAQRAHAARTT